MISSVISSCKLSWQEHVPSFVPRKHQPRINYNLSTQDEMSNQLDTEWAISNFEKKFIKLILFKSIFICV